MSVKNQNMQGSMASTSLSVPGGPMRYDNIFPSFTFTDAPTDQDLDFNMLSEYLLLDDGGAGGGDRPQGWTVSMEDFMASSSGPGSSHQFSGGDSPLDMSDNEGNRIY